MPLFKKKVPDPEPGSIVDWHGKRKVVIDIAEQDAVGKEVERGLSFTVTDEDGNERQVCRVATLRDPDDDPDAEHGARSIDADYVQHLTVVGHI